MSDDLNLQAFNFFNKNNQEDDVPSDDEDKAPPGAFQAWIAKTNKKVKKVKKEKPGDLDVSDQQVALTGPALAPREIKSEMPDEIPFEEVSRTALCPRPSAPPPYEQRVSLALPNGLTREEVGQAFMNLLGASGRTSNDQVRVQQVYADLLTRGNLATAPQWVPSTLGTFEDARVPAAPPAGAGEGRHLGARPRLTEASQGMLRRIQERTTREAAAANTFANIMVKVEKAEDIFTNQGGSPLLNATCRKFQKNLEAIQHEGIPHEDIMVMANRLEALKVREPRAYVEVPGGLPSKDARRATEEDDLSDNEYENTVRRDRRPWSETHPDCPKDEEQRAYAPQVKKEEAELSAPRVKEEDQDSRRGAWARRQLGAALPRGAPSNRGRPAYRPERAPAGDAQLYEADHYESDEP